MRSSNKRFCEEFRVQGLGFRGVHSLIPSSDCLNPSPTLGFRACRFRLHGGWYGTFEMEKLSPKDKAMEAGVI